MMNYADIIEFLNTIPKFSSAGRSAANFDLTRMNHFCEQMGNPQNRFPTVHVAGTNGKGTVCRMLASVYQEAGQKTGLYTSPHLIDFRERFRINGSEIDKNRLVEFFEDYGELIRRNQFTYFEITTAITFWWFAKEKVDLAIIETGLGGRLDATNVIRPLVSVITSIGLDHTDILGDTIEQIAREKAGIIKKNGKVVIGSLKPEAEKVIRQVAKEKDAIVFPAGMITDSKIYGTDANNHFPSKRTELLNAGIAKCVIETLQDHYLVTTRQFREGIRNTKNRFPFHANFEKLIHDENWYFDGAHNMPSVQELTDHLMQLAPPSKWCVVLSFMSDKLTVELAETWKQFNQIYLYEMEGQRAASLEEMKQYFPEAQVIESADTLLKSQFKSELVIFSGSFYFYNVVRNWMGALTSADHQNPPALFK